MTRTWTLCPRCGYLRYSGDLTCPVMVLAQVDPVTKAAKPCGSTLVTLPHQDALETAWQLGGRDAVKAMVWPAQG